MTFLSTLHAKIIAKSSEDDQRNNVSTGVSSGSHPISLSFGLIFCLILSLIHFIVWKFAALSLGESWGQVLTHWDAGWYLQIAAQGYDATRSAFLPAYPFLVRFFAGGQEAFLVWSGTMLSCLCLALSLVLLCRSSSPSRPSYFALGFFILSPASYVFHSVHTESLFLLLSILAFQGLERRQLFQAAVWAGLASLVRHQGVLLAIAIAWGFAASRPERLRGWKDFFYVGAISGIIWSCTPLFHLWQGRGAFPALSAHSDHWFMADGLGTYLKTLIMANPIQNYRFGSLLHQAYYFSCLGGTYLLLRQRTSAEAIYCLLSLAIMPLQGELIDMFRFSAVLFPILFLGGELVGRLATPWRWMIFLSLFALNLSVSWQYGISRWAY